MSKAKQAGRFTSLYTRLKLSSKIVLSSAAGLIVGATSLLSAHGVAMADPSLYKVTSSGFPGSASSSGTLEACVTPEYPLTSNNTIAVVEVAADGPGNHVQQATLTQSGLSTGFTSASKETASGGIAQTWTDRGTLTVGDQICAYVSLKYTGYWGLATLTLVANTGTGGAPTVLDNGINAGTGAAQTELDPPSGTSESEGFAAVEDFSTDTAPTYVTNTGYMGYIDDTENDTVEVGLYNSSFEIGDSSFTIGETSPTADAQDLAAVLVGV